MSGKQEMASSTAAAEGVDMDAELAQLLREQEHFMQQQKAPAAKVTRVGPLSVQSSNSDDSQMNEKEEKAQGEATVEPGAQVLRGIVERDVVKLDLTNVRVAPASGFPVARRRGKGPSLFGRRQRKSADGSQASAGLTPRPAMPKPQETQLEDRESRDIDAANRARLQDMSPAEILEAQQDLLRSLDPQLVEKLKKRKAGNKPKVAEKPLDEKQPVVPGKAVVKPDEQQDKQEKPETSQSLAMDLSAIKTEEELEAQTQLLPPEERAKLDWTQSAPKSTATPASTPKNSRLAGEEATLERFDLDGQVLEATNTQVPVHSGLFHHGDDPDAAGYTVPELLHLARSSVASQRAMALSVVAKILRKRQHAQHQVRPQPASPSSVSTTETVAPRVLPRDLAITLRIALDDQNYTALSAGVSALHAFLVPVETPESEYENSMYPELSLGAVLQPPAVHVHQNAAVPAQMDAVDTSGGLETPPDDQVVYIDTSESPQDGSSISDEQLAALDPVQALLHMDLGTRLRFILETVQLPDQNATEKMLEVLLTVARHSPRAAHELVSNTRLMKLLQRQYLENEHVLTFETDNVRALQLTLKALELVRALCQGQRPVASALIASGVIQSTKGFLALQETPTGGQDESQAATLFLQIQVESLRVWRVLLSYGLDFHCLAYLFPVLSGLETQASKPSIPRSTALYAALEAFCGLGQLHEAQHYFPQLGFFLVSAKDAVVQGLDSLLDAVDDAEQDQLVLLVAAALRFLAAASALATKYGLDTSSLLEVLELVQSRRVTQQLLPALSASTSQRELVASCVRFHRQVLRSGLLADDVDDEVVAQQFARQVQSSLLSAASSASTSTRNTARASRPALTQACQLVVLLGSLLAEPQDDASVDPALVRDVFALALSLVERLGPGDEFWVSRLLADVLFQQRVLQLLGVFPDASDAARMHRVLVPIYQALVNAPDEHEAHSTRTFAACVDLNVVGLTTPTHKLSCHWRLPQEEQTFVASNLPLPSFWLFTPFSRIEYTSSSGDNRADLSPTRAQSGEMQLIVSATSRFVLAFERLAPHLPAGRSLTALRPEDKLFHLLHVLFAGSDVLFDDHVDAALGQLLPTLVEPLLRSSADSRVLYHGLLRNLKSFQSLEAPNAEPPEPSRPSAATLSADDQQVLTFVEKLVAEFTASSFGNRHFARCVALLLARDLPLALRKLVWKELQDAQLLHALQPFEGDSSGLLVRRCTTGGDAPAVDALLLQLMMRAVCQQQVTPARGAFAYRVAVHHLVSYLFREGDAMSLARRQMAQELAATASPTLWRHLLSWDDAQSAQQGDMEAHVRADRVEKLRTQAQLTADQILSFEAAVSLLSRQH